jgi:deoxycytidylate deaminase
VKDSAKKLVHWDLKHLAIAEQVSKWSKDDSTKVGAVIADKDRRVVALGFNGFPKKVCDSPERLSNRGKKYPRSYMLKRTQPLLLARQPKQAPCTSTGNQSALIAPASSFRQALTEL